MLLFLGLFQDNALHFWFSAVYADVISSLGLVEINKNQTNENQQIN